MRSLVLIAALVGCGSEDDEAFTCERTDRSGTYFADFETVSGNCGEQADGLVQVGADSGPSSCQPLAPPAWSNGDCRLEVRQTCAIDAIHTVESISITDQQDADGDVITGTITFTGYTNGVIECAGTYRMTATRQ